VAREGDDLHKRIQQLPRVLALMDRHAVYPRAEACEKLLSACIATREIGLAAEAPAARASLLCPRCSILAAPPSLHPRSTAFAVPPRPLTRRTSRTGR